jgi:amidase
MTPAVSLSRDRSVYCFDKDAQPLAEIDAPAVVLFETHDARGGRLTRPDQVEETTPDFTQRFPATNPATGPVWVRGAEPGDTLVIDILGIDLDPLGFILVKPDMGVLRGLVERPIARMCRIADGMVTFNGLRFPVDPMVGVVAVAPSGDAIATAHVGRHGGNIDCRLIRVGCRLKLPVQVTGGLIYVGDVHAAMGDGEVTGTGVEVGAKVMVSIGLEKGMGRQWPVAEAGDHFWTLASAPTCEAATEIAVREMVDIVSRQYGVSRPEAFMLVSAVGDVGINQACRSAIDTSVRVVMPKPGKVVSRAEEARQ